MSDQDLNAPSSDGNTSSRTVSAPKTAIVLVAHGERGGGMQNASLIGHVGALKTDRQFCYVSGGVLNGEPNIQSALTEAKASQPERILVYPLFMADGYFVDEVIPKELQKAGCGDIGEILNPLGSDPGLAAVMLARAVGLTRQENLSPASARLLVVGHGSKRGSLASHRATQHFAAQLRGAGVFREVEIALLEEAPFVKDVLSSSSLPTVVVGYFYAPGLHAAEDVPEMIKETGADALYTGAVGTGFETTDLIRRSINTAIAAPIPSKTGTGEQTVVTSSPSSAMSFFGRLKCFFSGMFSRRTA